MKTTIAFLILAIFVQGISLSDPNQISLGQENMFELGQREFLSSNVMDVAVGTWHACVITTDGEVICWGANWAGQLGNGTWSESLVPTKVSGLSGVTKIVSGERHTCVLTVSGDVKCWGHNEFGQLGNGATYWGSPTPTDVIGLTSGVVSITAGMWHTCAVTNTGGVKCWGFNSYGQLGDGTTTNSSTPLDVVSLSSGVIAVAAGSEHTCALTSLGSVKCWGSNWAGQLGDGTYNNSLVPVSVQGLSSGALVLAVGYAHSCASTGIGVKCWGLNEQGQIGDGTVGVYLYRPSPVNVVSLSDEILSISVGKDFSCALNTQGGVKCWGRNSEGQLGDGTRIDSTTPVPTSYLTSGVSNISSKWQSTCAVLTGGSLKCWGMNDSGQAGDSTASRLLKPVSNINFTGIAIDLSAGEDHSCLRANDGNVYCWGQNDWGELGDNSRVNRTRPTIISGLNGIIAIDNGESHSCALNSQGGVVCWGHGWAGALGDGLSGHSFIPVNVNGLTSGVIQISSGAHHNCAVLNTGGIKCWGWNIEGQLGNGTTDWAWNATPTDVSGLNSGVTTVTSGRNHTCAILTNGDVKCWGSNWAGQLGDGTTDSSLVPVDVIGLTDTVAISLGIDHTCALTAAGGVKCWGANFDGELGDGTYISRTSPVDVSGLSSGVSKIANGGYHSCALLSGGGVRCWGLNISGQVGNNTVQSSEVPVDVIGLASGGQSIDAGYYHTCVLLTNGTIKCWGSNGYGQLGLGDIPWKIIPVDALLFTGIVPTPSDISFRPNPNGYKFDNSSQWYTILWLPYHTPEYDFSIDDLRYLFGDNIVCQTIVNGLCELRASAEEWYKKQLKLLRDGHCDGMSTTSLRFYKGWDQTSQFQENATTTFNLDFSNIRRHISYYHILQNTPLTSRAILESFRQTPNDVLNVLSYSFTTEAPDPYVLHIINPERTKGHALVPYQLEETTPNVWRIWVYDPNYEDDNNHFIVVNTTTNTWAYRWSPQENWVGNADSRTLNLVQLSAYKAEQTGQCPWCEVDIINLPFAQVFLTGTGGHLLITDPAGRRIGYEGETYLNEIPDASGIPNFGSGLVSREPMYYLPANSEYTMLLSGQTLTETQTLSLRQFGNGYVAGVDRTLTPDGTDTINISQDGTEINYQANLAGIIGFTLTDDSNADMSYAFRVEDVLLVPNKLVEVINFRETGKLAISDNEGGVGGTYYLKFYRVSTTDGRQIFVHANVPISITDTHYINYSTWDGEDDVIVEIDEGSDGTIDEIIQLDNELVYIYLPFIQR